VEEVPGLTHSELRSCLFCEVEPVVTTRGLSVSWGNRIDVDCFWDGLFWMDLSGTVWSGLFWEWTVSLRFLWEVGSLCVMIETKLLESGVATRDKGGGFRNGGDFSLRTRQRFGATCCLVM
jgi:hypothetical protein